MKGSTYDSVFFDFQRYWCIDEGKEYPKLRIFGDCPTYIEYNSFTYELFLDVFPNPFTNITEIKFCLQHPSSVNIQIYNFFGFSIKEVLNEVYCIEKTNILVFDGSTIPTGIYFIKLKASGKVVTKKLLIVR